VIDFWVAFSEVVIIVVRRLIREAGPATAGKVVPPDGHDLSAEPLTLTLAQSLRGHRVCRSLHGY